MLPIPVLPSRPRLPAAAICLALAAAPAAAQDAAARAYDLPAQPLNATVARIASDSGARISVDAELARGVTAAPVRGSLTAEAAMQQALAGSGLELVRTGSGVLTVRRAAAVPAALSATAMTLREVTVTANAERSAETDGTGSYAAHGATLFKGVQSLREIPQSVSVLTRQQMDDQGLTTVDAAMDQVTGVITTGFAGEPVFLSRGYRMSPQIDGVQSTSSNGRYASSLPALAMYDRIEVLRGPGGLLSGNGEPGGVINYVKKRPRHDPAVSARLSAGSWDQYYAELDATGPLNAEGTLRGRAVLAWQDEHKFYDVATDQAKLFYGVLAYDLTPATTLGLSASYSHRRHTPFWGLPRYSDGSLPARSSFVGYDHLMRTQQTDLGIDLEHRFNGGWRLKGGYSQVGLERTYLIGYGTSPIDVSTGLGNYLTGNDRYDSTDRSFDVNVTGPVQLFGRTHRLTFGYDRLESNTTMGAAPWGRGSGWDLLNNHDFSAWIPADGNQTQYRTARAGFYGHAHIRPADAWTFVLGGRWSDYRTKSRGVTVPADWNVSAAKANGRFTPFGGVLWDMTRQVTLYGSYAEIFEPQSDLDHNRQALKPRTGWQTEVGAKGEFFDGRLNASVALFRIRDENRSIIDPDPAHAVCGSSGTGSCSVAAGLWQSQGWEAEVSGSPARGWDVSASYTRTQTKVLRAASVDTENQVANANMPEHLFKFWTQYRPGTAILGGALEGWTFGAGVYASSRYAFSTLYPYQGGYATVSAKAGYRINRQWDATLMIGNLFDRSYLERAGILGAYNIYGKPRNFTLTLRGRF